MPIPSAPLSSDCLICKISICAVFVLQCAESCSYNSVLQYGWGNYSCTICQLTVKHDKSDYYIFLVQIVVELSCGAFDNILPTGVPKSMTEFLFMCIPSEGPTITKHLMFDQLVRHICRGYLFTFVWKILRLGTRFVFNPCCLFLFSAHCILCMAVTCTFPNSIWYTVRKILLLRSPNINSHP